MGSRRRRNRLTKEQRAGLYTGPDSNAGMGWGHHSVPEGPRGEAAQDAFDRDLDAAMNPEEELDF